MARLAFYVLVGLEGDAMIVWGGVEHRLGALVVGLVVAVGSVVMLATGWWLKWERTVEPPKPTLRIFPTWPTVGDQEMKVTHIALVNDRGFDEDPEALLAFFRVPEDDVT